MAADHMWMHHVLQKVESVLAKIDSPAIQQVASSLHLHHHIGRLSHTLHHFKDLFSHDNDHIILSNHESPEWMLLFDAENMLDDIHSHSHWKQKQKQKQKQKLLLIKALINKVGHFFFSSLSSSSSSSPSSRALATQIQLITHTFQHFASDALHANPREFSFLWEDSNDVGVIGREIDKEIIIEKLLLMMHDDQSVVLPIVGMGGVGKSTLANIVFHDKRICESFSVRIWVSLSGVLNTEEEVSFQIINPTSSFGTTIYRSTLIELQRDLQILFTGEKFILVLDDVQRQHSLKLDELRRLILIGANTSKVLLTTRSHLIASMMGTIPTYNLQPLSSKDSLSLFEKLATKAKAHKYPRLIKIGREIVNQCGGVPFAIKEIGSELLSPDYMVEWKSTRNSDFWDFPKNNGILFALKLSYYYIPLHLKQCFQLFSLYPNDFVFHSSEIVSLWAALDLLPSPNTDETLIDVSYQCLQKIIPKYFFKEFVNFGTSYYFQIHNLLHDLARDMAEYECLMINSDSQHIPEGVQHLSFIIDNLFDRYFMLEKYDYVRTLLFPVEGVGVTSESFFETCLSKCMHLRILDLSDSIYEVLPRSIGKLRHLRFLSLERNEKIKRVPDSINNLLHLQILNLAGCKELRALPKGLRNLANLRHLGITTKESTLPENDIATLDFLEFLRIESCDKLKSLLVGIKLPSLKTLEVTHCGNLKYLALDIDHFPQLETLLIDNCDNLELIKRHGDQSSNLQFKAISLHSLPKLLSLPLWLQYSRNTLQFLSIVDCKNFKVFPEWLSSFSVLGSFCIVNCPELMSLPNDIHCLVALEYLRIEDCPELCGKCQPQDGEYWFKISHIKQIFIGKPEDPKEEEE